MLGAAAVRCAVIAALVVVGPTGHAEEAAGGAFEPRQAGHSVHGTAFNEGPRQRAYLMAGMPKVDFPISCKGDGAQAFFNQGIGQLHGYWYFESERSFRQVVAIDASCAIAYWGMAMANAYDEPRARTFVKRAAALREKADARERRWIDSLEAFYGDRAATPDEWQVRRRDYLRALEAIVAAYPDDVEAKAFLVSALWDFNGNFTQFDKGIPSLSLPSRVAVEALAREVLAKNPLHPLHHYLIHIWDGDFAERGLPAAYRSGPSGPGIAHLWHMAGHIYSKLHRYHDTVWAQEASARVDHAYMARDDIFPDQIHNYAHNNDWLVQSYAQVGRVHDAIELAKNLVEIPRHPRWNAVAPSAAKGAVFATAQDKRENSAHFGRRRLFEVGVQYELWAELLALRDGGYLEDPGVAGEDEVAWARAIGLAAFARGRRGEGDRMLARLEQARARAVKPQPDASKSIDAAIAELGIVRTVAGGGRPKLSADVLRALEALSKQRRSVLLFSAGERDRALVLAREAADAAPGEVLPLASLADLLARAGRRDDAVDAFRRLLPISGDVDLDVPVFGRIGALGASVGRNGDWRSAYVPPPELARFRVPLGSLGPRFWTPPRAPDWTLPRSDGKPVALASYRGKPVIVIFYLGYGCVHCLEQLAAFAPAAKQFAAAGISLVAVSTDAVAGLAQTVDTATRAELPFPIVSDQSLATFKKYRAFDGFENIPLHGTFLIDGQGLIRWHDVSYEPFKDVGALLAEAKRLLRVKVRAPDKAVAPAKELAAR